MANYKNPQKISFTQEEEKRFRQLFNQWGASVEGYNRDDLGDSLKVIEVWDSPLYRASLKRNMTSVCLKTPMTVSRAGNPHALLPAKSLI